LPNSLLSSVVEAEQFWWHLKMHMPSIGIQLMVYQRSSV